MNRAELKTTLIVSILLMFSFPPFPLGFLVPAALAIYLHFLEGKSPRQAFRLGYWLGLLWGTLTLFWIASSTLAGAVVTILINSLHYALVWWLYALFRQRSRQWALLSLPFIWTAAEYTRQFSDLRFNWMTLAYTQTYYRPLIQIIEYTGDLFLSFILLWLAVLFYLLLTNYSRWKWRAPLLASGMLLILLGFGEWRIHSLQTGQYPMIRAALVQPNVDPFRKWEPEFQHEAFRMLMEASREVAASQPDLIVWPETATPFYLRARAETLMHIHQFLDSTGIYLLTGTPDYRFSDSTGEYRTYNAAFFFRPHHSYFQTYYKMALVPAAESMPFKNTLSFLRKIDVGGGDFFAGSEYSVFRFTIPFREGVWDGQRYVILTQDTTRVTRVGLSAVICYESVFPDIVRKFVRRGANLLSIITNDGWFGQTTGPFQHARYAVFRAVENRVSVIRCANTGISGFIDPTGRYLQTAALNTRQNLIGNLPIIHEQTFFTRHGDWFGKIILYVALLLIFIKLVAYGVGKRPERKHGTAG